MKKKECIVCSQAKGKRICKINNELLICSICCAQIRNPNCEGCSYYAQAEQYAKEKVQKSKSQRFIMRIDPEVDEAVDRALAMVERGKIQEGERIVSELLKDYPDIYTVHYAMGVIYAMKGHYDESIAYFDKTIEIFPYCVEAWYNKAVAHKNRLDVEETIRAFQMVVELGNPREDFVRDAKDFIESIEKQIREESGLSLEGHLKVADQFNEAFAAMEKGEWEKALRGFQRVLKLNPKNTQSYGNMGICYANLERKEEAIEALKRALELDPKYEPALVNLSAMLAMEEGGPFDGRLKVVDYYKDYSLRKKSLLESLLSRGRRT